MILDDSVNENKALLKKYADVWDGIKNEIKVINGGKENDYGKDYMKIKLNSDDDLPLNKSLRFHVMAIIIKSVFEEGGKLYPQAFLDDNLYELYKCYSTKKTMFQKELILICLILSVSKECMLCHYWYFKYVGFKFEPHVCNKCHDVLMTANELKNIAILNVKGVDFRCILWGISRDEAVNRLNNSMLEGKSVL